MGDNNDNYGYGGDQNQDNQPWVERYAMEIIGQMHNLPRHPKNILPKFDLETSRFPKDHINKFILAIRGMNVKQEDVVSIFFPYTFENSGST
jgi:hypothetical protein